MKENLPPTKSTSVVSSGASTDPDSLAPSKPTKGHSEEKLIGGLVAHREESWREFFARFDRTIRSAIRSAVRRMQGRVTEEDYREIHATFIATLFSNEHHKLCVFDPARGRSIGSWLALLAERTTVDWMRSLRAQERAHRSSVFASLAAQSHGPLADELVEKKRLIERVRKAVATLAPRHRELFELYFVEGLDAWRVAERMGISIQTVHSGRNKIETQLARAARAAQVPVMRGA